VIVVYRPTPQPAKGVLAMARIRNTEVARRLGCSAIWVGRVLNGEQRPPERFRKVVAELVGKPESELFVWDNEPAKVVAR
jgi:transcriptional regulator with XRE-family HTH domain